MIRAPSRILTAATPSPPTSKALSKLMDSRCSRGSQRLSILAQQLCLYKLPPSLDHHKIEESVQNIVSQAGFPEPSAQTGCTKGFGSFRPKKAAVLICLFEGDGGELRVILTKRSSGLSSHSGEVSLPGGMVDERDGNNINTAMREAKEEIGLDPSLVNVVTVLEPFLSKQLEIVVPVIGILSDKKAFNPTPNAAEVEAVFDAPLEMFLKDENRRVEERIWNEYEFIVHFFDYEVDTKKYVIWGVTAAILIRSASVVYQRPPAFLEQKTNFKVPGFANKGATMA